MSGVYLTSDYVPLKERRAKGGSSSPNGGAYWDPCRDVKRIKKPSIRRTPIADERGSVTTPYLAEQFIEKYQE